MEPKIIKRQLTKRQYLGEGFIHTFVNDTTGEFVNVPCSRVEYEALSQVPPINPTLDGHTWRYSQGGTVMVDTPDTILGLDEYCDYEGKYLVNSIDSEGLQRIEKVAVTNIVKDSISEAVLKDVAIANFAEALNAV